jgi:holin-like protein
MPGAMAVLLIFQLLGELIVRLLELPVPGPVVGLVLLFLVLLWRGAVPPALKETSLGLLQHLSLLFIPAGVGVMEYFDLIRAEWLALVTTLIGSTLLTIVLTAALMQLLLRVSGGAAQPAGRGE